MKKYKCPVCGYFTFESEPNGTYDICPVCFWEDDPVAYKEPDKNVGGANNVSLEQARINYKEFGASEKDLIKYVRKPENDELSGIE